MPSKNYRENGVTSAKYPYEQHALPRLLPESNVISVPDRVPEKEIKQKQVNSAAAEFDRKELLRYQQEQYQRLCSSKENVSVNPMPVQPEPLSSKPSAYRPIDEVHIMKPVKTTDESA